MAVDLWWVRCIDHLDIGADVTGNPEPGSATTNGGWQIFNSILAGADGYILKTAPPEKLITGIYEVAQGGSAMTASVARRVMELFRTQQQNPQKEKLDLTDREIEVLNFLSRGLSQKMVASEMQLSSFTVNNHLKKIYQKLHVHSAPEAIAVATKKRII